jgi:hypothetical protein
MMTADNFSETAIRRDPVLGPWLEKRGVSVSIKNPTIVLTWPNGVAQSDQQSPGISYLQLARQMKSDAEDSIEQHERDNTVSPFLAPKNAH